MDWMNYKFQKHKERSNRKKGDNSGRKAVSWLKDNHLNGLLCQLLAGEFTTVSNMERDSTATTTWRTQLWENTTAKSRVNTDIISFLRDHHCQVQSHSQHFWFRRLLSGKRQNHRLFGGEKLLATTSCPILKETMSLFDPVLLD